MKRLIYISTAIVVTSSVAYFSYNSEKVSESSQNIQETNISVIPPHLQAKPDPLEATLETVPAQHWPAAIKNNKLKPVDEAALQDGEKKLTQLVDEYSKHLDDPEKRKELENKLASSSDAYKQEVLAKVKLANNKESK